MILLNKCLIIFLQIIFIKAKLILCYCLYLGINQIIMKRLFLKNLFIPFLLFFASTVHATGPSYVNSEMNPVSVNEKGEILCRTRFVINDMGSHWYDRVEYGLCIISNGEIKEYLTKILDPSIVDDNTERPKDKITGDEYIKLMNHWDWIFKTGFDFDKLSKQQKRICEEYEFKENNAGKYKVDKKIKLADFEKERNIDLSKNKQLALKKAKSISYEDRQLHILYDFGDVLILNNIYREDPEIDAGASFSYISPFFGGIEYEYYRITGSLFLNK